MTDDDPLSASALLASPPSHLTPDALARSIPALPPAAQVLVCANLVLAGRVIDQRALRAIVELGLAGGEEEAALLEGDVRARLLERGNKSPLVRAQSAPTTGSSQGSWEGWGADDVRAQVESIAENDAPRRALIAGLAVLHGARRRLDTFDAFYPPIEEEAPAPAPAPVEDMEVDLDDDPWADGEDDDKDVPPILDDPWAEDAEDEPVPEPSPKAKPLERREAPPIDAATFVLESLVLSALYFATGTHLAALRITAQRHGDELWPFRTALIEAVPGWVSPGEDDFLPLLLAEGDEEEGPWPRGKVDIPDSSLLGLIAPQYGIPSLRPQMEDLFPAQQNAPLSSEAVSQWYISHVLALDDLGLLDAQLAWVQHGTALGVSGLDAIGEELSLLSRLIYDASLTPEQLAQWSLTKWRDASEEEIVRAYLSNATEASIVTDLRRHVMPYLYVLEARAERSGNADPDLVPRMLHGAILDLPLSLAIPCFDASKATLPASARLVKDDKTVARLALAVLYGSDAQDSWSSMSAIFECLPVWDVSGGDADTDREATETTLESIADFVRPTASSAGAHSARDLFMFFKPLPFASLSRALDILDVHLESGEILSRYGVRVYLRTLLQSARNHDEQITLAEQMVRRGNARGDERRWIGLWEDMCRLQGGNDALLRGAFGMLSKEEMMRIFLGGLLSSGFFPVAKKVIRRLEPEGYFAPEDLEKAVLTTSNEFYMRAETGNIHTGDMKLAYECLSVAPQTDAIRAEQDFIQATSRITSFRAPQLASLTPAEIRHTRDKLDLVRQVLATSDDAYRHPPIILELADKLGYRGDTAARAEVLAMMCDAAVADGQWEIAKERVDEMAAMVEPDTATESEESKESKDAAKVREVTYRASLALGAQEAYPDLVGRMALLAQALAFAPAADVPSILPQWQRVQDAVIASPDALRAHAVAGAGAKPSSAPVEGRVLGSRTAARAASAANSAAKWGLDNLRSFTNSPALPGLPGIGKAAMAGKAVGRGRASAEMSRQDSRDSTRSGSRGSFEGWRDRERDAAALFDDEDDGVRAGARRALVKGVGWLLGDEGR